MEEKDFHAGDIVTLRLMVTRGAYGERHLVSGASVTVKVLGTEFRPLILSSKTDSDGVAMVHAWLPRFTKGRAAILLRATSDGCAAELRRVIHQS
jgi:phosphatidate phosphatase APP1